MLPKQASACWLHACAIAPQQAGVLDRLGTFKLDGVAKFLDEPRQTSGTVSSHKQPWKTSARSRRSERASGMFPSDPKAFGAGPAC